jgi:hypothetical protein
VSASKFTPEARGSLVERARTGVSLADSCRAMGLRLNTAKAWISRGRREPHGPYAAFVAALETARQEAIDRPEPLSEDEHRRLVSGMVRSGSVAAAKLYWTMLEADRSGEEVTPDAEDNPLAEVDELARVRQRR